MTQMKNMSKIILFFTVLLFSLSILMMTIDFGKDKEFIVPAYPLATYSDPGLKEMTNMILKPNEKYKVYASLITLQDTTGITTFWNIMRYTTSYSIRPDGSLWCSLNMSRSPSQENPGIWLPYPVFGKDCRFLPYLLLSLSFLCMFIWFYLRTNHRTARLLFYCSIFFSLWISCLLYIFYFNGFYILYGLDPDQFIDIAKEWLRFERHTRICNSIGTAFFYIPFITFCKVKDFFDIAVIFSIFNFMVFGAGSLILTIFIARLISGCNEKAVTVTAFAATLLPFTAWVMRREGPWNPIFWGKTLFIIRNDHPYSMIFYNKSLLFAWNGMSDSIAVFFMLLGIFFLIFMKVSFKKYFILGVVLGFSMSVRYGSITILPAVFLYDIFTLYQAKVKFRDFIKYYILFAVSGLLAFSPQLIDNYMVNGHIFAPSVMEGLYSGGNKISNLFSIGNLSMGYFFFLKVHFKVFLLYTLLLFVVKDLKLSLMFWLWIFVPLTFYSSLNFNSHSEIRYIIIIFPAFYLIAGMASRHLNPRELVLVLVALAANFIFASPESSTGLDPFRFPFWVHFLIPSASVLYMLLLIKLRLISVNNGLFFITYFMFLTSGVWWFILLGLLIFPVFRLLDLLGGILFFDHAKTVDTNGSFSRE